MQIVLHSDDILLTEHWEKSIKEKCILIDDIEELKSVTGAIIIINYSACNSQCEDILKQLTQTNKVLILHRTPNIDTAKYILTHGAKGYGNALMRDHFIISAIETIRENMIWLYPEFTTMLIAEIPSKKNNNLLKLDILSSREKEVALLLKDALAYKEIAIELDITPRTVKAHASHIYKKLAVKDRLGLALLLK
ncbi:MAG: NarL family two-component system response regulator LiaR [Sulfurimonas sp.]|jgi:NarL family two-component system response regulator LiaR|uniref:response regulator transcription factor n=1 Tax=Sulfurimonas sp. TaxID=2022749 RepID=UPI0039E40A89